MGKKSRDKATSKSDYILPVVCSEKAVPVRDCSGEVGY